MGSMIDEAEYFAAQAHKGQVRKYTGEPYIAHPGRVIGNLIALTAMPTVEMRAAAWLHDVVEDTPVTLEEIGQRFGPVVRFLVDDLTKPNEPMSVSGMIIKACDLVDNLRNIAEVAPAVDALAYLLAKAPQVVRIAEEIKGVTPMLAEQLVQTWWRNWGALDNRNAK